MRRVTLDTACADAIASGGRLPGTQAPAHFKQADCPVIAPGTLAEDAEYFQSSALRMFTLCIQAGALGGLAAYVHACDLAGLHPLVPDSASDVRDVSIILADIDSEYYAYWTRERAFTLVSAGVGNADARLRNPAFTSLFTNVLERLLTWHRIGNPHVMSKDGSAVLQMGRMGAFDALYDMARIHKDGASGKLGVPAGTWVRHVLASLVVTALEAGKRYDDSNGLLRDTEALYSLDGQLLAVMPGVSAYLDYLADIQGWEDGQRSLWRSLYNSEAEYIPPRKTARKPQRDTQAARMAHRNRQAAMKRRKR